MVDPTAAAALAVAAVAGGALGAAVGGLRAYALAGIAITVGELSAVAGGPETLGLPFSSGLLGATGITGSVGLGPVLGPHVAFAGAVAAAAYAAREGDPDPDFRGYEAKNLARVRGPAPRVLVAGGAFGLVGLALARGSAALALPWDPVAASVVASAFLHRLALGYPLVGVVPADALARTPFAEREPRTDGGADASEGDVPLGTRFVLEPWPPGWSPWATVGILGAVVGAAAALVTYLTGSPLLAFGLALAALGGRVVGAERVPATHHLALPAGVAVVGLAGAADPSLVDGTARVAPDALSSAVGLPAAVGAGAAFGLLGALLGEVAERTLYARAHTHLDPAMASLVATSFLLALLDAVGLLGQSVVPTPL